MTEVKIDKELHKRVAKFIKVEENRFDFPTIKSFVDKAILLMLKEAGRKLRKANKIKKKNVNF